MLNGEHTSGALARPSLQLRGSLRPRRPALFVAHDDPEPHGSDRRRVRRRPFDPDGGGLAGRGAFVERSEETLPAVVAKKLNTFGGSSGPTGTGSRRTTSLGEIVP